jgi:serine protease Do
VDAKGLPAITLADSDKIEVGDVVLAIGNPFNVGQSVTMGIVSAMGRGGFNITDYEDFIQTDAPINPGNSGGALVDTEGRLVGINQSIVSRTGANAGIGFAVPVNLARVVLERLVADGTVRRGYLGVLIQPVTPELAKAFELPSDVRGALVGGVSPGTPAEKAGIKEGDVITEVNGRKANDSQHVRLMISQLLPGTKASLKLIRDGKERTLSVTLGELSKDGEVVEASTTGEAKPLANVLAGVELGDLSLAGRREHSIPNHVRGALVVAVEPESKAATAGLRPGNVIQEINRHVVESAEAAAEELKNSAGEQVLLRVWSRDGGMNGSRFVTLDAAKK